MALRAGFEPARIHMHGNNKSDEEILLRRPLRRRPPDPRLLRRDRALRAAARPPPAGPDPGDPGDQALDPRLRRRPGSSTRSSASGSRTALRGAAIERVLRLRAARAGRAPRPHRLPDLRARALHAGDPRARRAGRRLVPGGQRRRRPRRSPTPPRTSRRAIDDYVEVKVRGVAEVFGDGVEDPGRARALAGRQRRRHRLPGRHGQGDPRRAHLRRRRRRHVRQPAADALRLALRGADRRPGRGPARHDR